MNLNFLSVHLLTLKTLGTLGTSGTGSSDAGFCVPTENPMSGNTGNETGDAEPDTMRCSHLFPAYSRVLGTEFVNVYAAVPTVPAVPTQVTDVSKNQRPPASRWTVRQNGAKP
jgi:hypothetical protein